jgi:SAM-dependent methyltransferase
VTDPLDDIRTSYDTVAVSYAELVQDGPPEEAANLDLFAKLASGRVLDVGCGPGRVAGLLHDRGLDVIGIDLSPGMIDIARREHPGPDFRVGSMTDVDLPDGELGGVISWWSIIHLPRAVVPQVFAEFYRVLAPGGVLLLGFHVGEESTHKTSGYGGHPMNIHVHRWMPAALIELAVAAGFTPYVEDLAIPEDYLFFRK